MNDLIVKVRTAEQLPMDTCLVTWTEENIHDFWAIYLTAMNNIGNRFNYVLTHTDDYLLSEKKIATCRELKSELDAFHRKVLEQAQLLSNRTWDANSFLLFGNAMLFGIKQFRQWIDKVNALQKDIDDWAKCKVSEKNKGKKTRLHLLPINWSDAYFYAWDRLFVHMYDWLFETLWPYFETLSQTNSTAESEAKYVILTLNNWRIRMWYQFQKPYWNNRELVSFLSDLDMWWHSFTYLLEALTHGDDDFDFSSYEWDPEEYGFTTSYDDEDE